MKHHRTITGLLLVVGLASAGVGQFYFAYRREFLWDGLLFWGVAIIALVALLWQTERPMRSPAWRFGWIWASRRSRARVLLASGGAVLSLLAGLLARQRAEGIGFTDLLLLWLFGVALFVTAQALSAEARKADHHRLFRWLRVHRWDLARGGALLLAALAVRAIGLEHIPVNLGGDEGTWGMEGMAMVTGRMANPFATRWFGFPSLSFLAWGLSMRVFGETVAGLRALSAILGTLTVITTFLMARELWGERLAWLAAVMLTFGHFHLHYSRLAVNNIADGLLVTLALWLLVRGLRTKQAVCFALAGVSIGLGWYAYFGARLIGGVVACYLGLRWVMDRDFRGPYAGLLAVLVAAALVVVLPLLLYYADHPDLLNVRANQVNIFTSGWLAREQEITGRTALSLFLQQVWKSVSAFNYTLDPTFWYRPTIPLLDAVSGMFFAVGLLWTSAHWRQPSNGLLLTWFWAAVILGWVFTENPPSSMRLVITAPALAMLVSLGLNWVLGLGQSTSLSRARAWAGAALGLTIATANLYYYFAVYTPSRVYGNPTAEVGTELGRYLKTRDDGYVVRFHAPPIIYWDFGTLRFLARGREGVDVPPLGEGELGEPDLSRGVRFVFLPERLGELASVRSEYPGGAETSVNSDADGRLLYVMYEVAPTSEL